MFGYLDAGSGSMVVGAVAAGAAGVGVVARMAWAKVTPKGRRRAAEDAAETEDPTGSDDDGEDRADERVDADAAVAGEGVDA